MPKILITGGNGFLGGNLARDLYKKGYEIKLMIRSSADTTSIADIPSELCYASIENKEEVSMAVKDCDFVVHTASLTGQWGIDFSVYEKINITGTKNLLDACLLHKVKRIIHVSTANTMAPGTKKDPGTELNSFGLFHMNSGYINSKYIAQQHVLEYVEQKKLPAIVINPTFMLGEYDAKPSSGQIILYGMHKRILFYPPGGKNFVHVQDVCASIVNALEFGKIGECYLAAGENLSYNQFFKLLGSISGQKQLRIKIPALALKTAGLIGSLAGRFTGKSKKINFSTASLLCLDNYYSGKKSERELNIRYTSIDKAVRGALSWFRENNYC